MAFIIPALIITAGLFALSFLLAKDRKVDAVRDDRPTTITTRGSYIPWVLGRRMVAPVVGWVGNNNVIETTETQGGKGGGGETEVTHISYSARGWHQICSVPACRCYGIWDSGKKIYGSFDILGTPSGTTLNTSKGPVRWYWGNVGQPVDSLLEDKLGIASRWERMCFCVWDQYQQGSTPRWGQLEYDIEVCDTSSTSIGGGADPWIDTGNAEGANPAYAVWQITTAPFPWGCGMPVAHIAFTALQELGAQFVTDGWPCNILVQDGLEAAQVIGELMHDYQFVMPQVGSVLCPYAIRKETGSVPLLGSDILLPPYTEIERTHDKRQATKLTFLYRRANKRFRPFPVHRADDGATREHKRSKTQTINLQHTTWRQTASRLANRLMLEYFVEPTRMKFRGLRNLRDLIPGHPIDIENVGRVRVGTIEYNWDDLEVTLDCLVDLYTQSVADFDDPEPITEDYDVVALDLRWTIYEIPARHNDGSIRILALRSRAHQAIAGAHIHASLTGISYEFAGTDFAGEPAGTLNGDWDRDDIHPYDMIVEDGFTVDFDNPPNDVEYVQNLDSDLAGWYRGKQAVVINGEVFYVRRWDLVSGDTYQAIGVIRAREDTEPSDHSMGDDVYVVDTENPGVPIQSPLFSAGETVKFKTQPFDDSTVVDLSDVTEKEITLIGKAFVPLPVDNIQVGRNGFWYPHRKRWDGTGYTYTVVSGQKFDVRWTAKIRGVGAGDLALGQGVESVPSYNGTFILRWYAWDGVSAFVLVQTDEVDALTFTLNWTGMREDWGPSGIYSQPAFIRLDITNVDENGESEIRSITMTNIALSVIQEEPEYPYP